MYVCIHREKEKVDRLNTLSQNIQKKISNTHDSSLSLFVLLLLIRFRFQ